MKVLGCICILWGGGGICAAILKQRQRRTAVLREMIAALRQIAEMLRMTRHPLPQLFFAAAESCKTEVQGFFRLVGLAAKSGENPAQSWRKQLKEISLTDIEKQALEELGSSFRQDEEGLCRALDLTVGRLEESAREEMCRRMAQNRQTVACCLSGAAFLMILLI